MTFQYFLCHLTQGTLHCGVMQHTPPAAAAGAATTTGATTAAAAAAALLARFHRQRPLRAGSLIVTLFGDSIMPRGGAVSLGSLIQLALPFGLNERLVRTAAARLAHEGWVETRRVGKRSEYRLTATGRARFAEATERIYGAAGAPWSGRWTLLILPPMPSTARQRLRKELAWQGFGELSTGIFAHPQLRAGSFEGGTRPAELPPRALLFDADLTSPATPSFLIEAGWDLKELGRRYRQFAARFERVRLALDAAPDPQTGFVLRTLLIHEYRRLHLRDPLLPERLLPAAWPGIRAAGLCRDIYARVFAASEAHLSAAGARLEGALPPADRSVLQRFGGIAPGSPGGA
ncbi:MAG TPA: phenylacetic acid degradation operon negative regulatory protein PaaX [Steroidobacteraceae bacterium]|nr:phenylacetic acid degradation operon negative regulatory protein PaaX [Steroidobacteraceae bacterium]